jgi:hypothetical protein
MEDVLETYMRRYDSKHPLVCMDETNKQHIKETRVTIPMKSGRKKCYDHEYERNGVSNLFMFFSPTEKHRYVKVTDRRTRTDWAHAMKELSDEKYPDAEKITVVLDNLNTHGPASFYEAFEPSEAQRLSQRFEFHYTPKHGSWLNMAEIELSILSRQCLARRIPNQKALKKEVAAWEKDRNAKYATIDWQFTTKDARIKLRRLYPTFHV